MSREVTVKVKADISAVQEAKAYKDWVEGEIFNDATEMEFKVQKTKMESEAILKQVELKRQATETSVKVTGAMASAILSSSMNLAMAVIDSMGIQIPQTIKAMMLGVAQGYTQYIMLAKVYETNPYTAALGAVLVGIGITASIVSAVMADITQAQISQELAKARTVTDSMRAVVDSLRF
ncbi:MAG: hypothetical protein JRJ62_01585 [Deltaproteobacteria bacterium]|nr:hypothetical protein [Deltaproteobacteria bacterium]